jgi:Protein of unknown function (DUF3604)
MKKLFAVLILSVAAAVPSFAAPNPERDAYFGETHIHTSWSVDAWVIGNRITGPDEAFKYAQDSPSSTRWASKLKSRRQWISWG